MEDQHWERQFLTAIRFVRVVVTALVNKSSKKSLQYIKFSFFCSAILLSVSFSAALHGSEGFISDDVYVIRGEGQSRGILSSALQAEAMAVQAARIDAERRFMELCTTTGAAGGACGDMIAERKDLSGRLRSAKVMKQECEKTQDNPVQLFCKVWLRVEAKGLKQTCEKARVNSAPSCAR